MAVKGQSIARALNDRLTEEGLKRIIVSTSPYPRSYINELPPEILALKIAAARPQNMSRGGRVVARKSAPPTVRHKKFWKRVTREIHIFLCTNDKKYADLRNDLRRQTTKGASQMVLVGMLSVGIAPYLGTGLGMITPIVATFLLIVLRMGVNAYCAGRR